AAFTGAGLHPDSPLTSSVGERIRPVTAGPGPAWGRRGGSSARAEGQTGRQTGRQTDRQTGCSRRTRTFCRVSPHSVLALRSAHAQLRTSSPSPRPPLSPEPDRTGPDGQVEMMALSRLLWPLLVTCGCVAAQELPANGLNGYSLHPPYFNLAEGTKITATATCGLDDGGRSVQDLYCKLVGGPVSGDPSQTIQGQYCDICSQGSSDRAHPITNAIDGTERWWQSPPLSRSTEYNQVNVTLDLGQLFHVAYVLIKFANSPRPDLWVLERSTDFGQTYQPWQYFASSKRDCIERFGQKTIERINSDDDVICTTDTRASSAGERRDRGVPGERSPRGHELLLLPGAEGLHQGHQHPAALPEDQHAAGTPDGQGAAGPHRDPPVLLQYQRHQYRRTLCV
ncbi:hypothetical protein OJAV_G00072220, partial [Oryzias javanicus]